MKIVKLGPRRGTPKQCHSAGCNRSASYDMILLATSHELFCVQLREGHERCLRQRSLRLAR
jgi:hypothetical protein